MFRYLNLSSDLSSYLLKWQFAILRYLFGIEQPRMSYFQVLNTLRQLQTFWASSLVRTRWLTSPDPIQHPMDPSCFGSLCLLLIKQWPVYIIFPNFLKCHLPKISGWCSDSLSSYLNHKNNVLQHLSKDDFLALQNVGKNKDPDYSKIW